MKTPIEPTAELHPLDALSAQADSLNATQAEPLTDEEQQAQDGNAAAAQAIEAGAAKVLFGLLKAVRAVACKKLPELRTEWTDEILQGPADAAVPLLRQHMARLMEIAGGNPELTIFAFSLLPLVMGWLAAMDRAALNEKRTVQADDGNGDTQA